MGQHWAGSTHPDVAGLVVTWCGVAAIRCRARGLGPERERLVRIEAHVPHLHAATYASAAAYAHRGFDVVMDVGHHGAYSRELAVWADCARELDGLAYLLVGVECPLEVIWERREATWGQKREEVDQGVLAAVEQGQARIHTGLDYDLMVDTSVMSPDECAGALRSASGRRDSALSEW